MNFFLTGVETNNKGAELMLYAILQEIERKFPGSTLYIEQGRCKQGASYVQTPLSFEVLVNKREIWRSRLFRYTKLASIYRILHRPQPKFYTRIPKVDYMIDGSGFHFSDQMHAGQIRPYWKSLLRQAKKRGAKIVFLPQAFGPVEHEDTKEAVGLLSKYADLICAREQVSFDYLQKSGACDMSKVKVFTDFTSLVEPSCPKEYEHLAGGVCVIPNMQMVNKGVLTMDAYLSYIQKIVDEASHCGRKVYLLNHQGAVDEILLTACRERMKDIECISGLNALDTKGLISTAYAVITSRFHGLASSLNSCIPSLATSWSHKYQCLFEDYGQKGGVLSLTDIETDMSEIRKILDPENNAEIRRQLSERIPEIKEQNRKMWETVWSL